MQLGSISPSPMWNCKEYLLVEGGGGEEGYNHFLRFAFVELLV